MSIEEAEAVRAIILVISLVIGVALGNSFWSFLK